MKLHKTFLLGLSLILAFSLNGQSSITVTSLADLGGGSLRAAMANANPGDTIRFDTTIAKVQNDTIKLFSEILTDTEVHIIGNSTDSTKLYISGQGQNRIFFVDIDSVSSKRNFSIHNVHIIDGHTSGIWQNGGAIFIDFADTVGIFNCSFSNCYATLDGGVLSSPLGPVTKGYRPRLIRFVNTNFFGNESPGNGGIHLERFGTASFYNCLFAGNRGYLNYFRYGRYVEMERVRFMSNAGTAQFPSAGRCNYLWSTDSLKVNDCEAGNNQTDQGGSVFYFYTGYASFTSSKFYGNTCDSWGGAIHAPNSGFIKQYQFKQCVFRNNTAGSGGAVAVNSAIFDSCIFRSNTAGNGGALRARASSFVNDIEMINCQLDSNLAGPNLPAGGAAVSGIKGHFIFRNSTASYNHSVGSTGVFSMSGSYFGPEKTWIINSTICHNSAADRAAVLSSYEQDVKIINSTIYDNHSQTTGSVFFATWQDSLEFQGSIIAGNSSPLVELYSSGSQLQLFSGGNNLLQTSNLTINGLVPTDFPDIDTNLIRLAPLANNGGFCKTLLPLPGSLAINRGNPLDSTDAQNGPVVASIRDIGAAESADSSLPISILACDSVLIGGSWYDSAGVVLDTLQNQAGSDSVVSIYIQRVSPSSADTSVIISCTPVTWLDGMIYDSTTDTAVFITNTQYGCDSIIYLDFTLEQDTSMVIDSISACEPYTWIDGLVYDSNSDTSSFLLSRSDGCDSLVMLHFIYIDLDTSLQVTGNNTLSSAASNVDYTWINCTSGDTLQTGSSASFTAPTTGFYAVILDGGKGCVDTSACIYLYYANSPETDLPLIELYPNIVSDNLVIEIDPDTKGQWEFILIDSKGAQSDLPQSLERGKNVLNLAVAPGVYQVLISNDQGVRKIFRIVKR